ncbi:transposase [Candidatus Enterovibrio escicola]|nr:transposase [Candidatus Enterovibrio escacola]
MTTKNISQIEYSRHRNYMSFMVNLLGVYRVFITTKETAYQDDLV